MSIRAVSEAVGVTPPSIYLHFADKNELIFAICERCMDELDRATTEAAGSSDDPIRVAPACGEGLRTIRCREPGAVSRVFVRKLTDTPLPWQQDKILNSSAFGHLRQDVARAVEAGRLEGDPILVSVFLWATATGSTTSLFISKPNFPVARSRPTRRSLRTISIAGCVAGPVTTVGQEIPPTGTCLVGVLDGHRDRMTTGAFRRFGALLTMVLVGGVPQESGTIV